MELFLTREFLWPCTLVVRGRMLRSVLNDRHTFDCPGSTCASRANLAIHNPEDFSTLR